LVADEYDAAQTRGEVAPHGGDKSKFLNGNFAAVDDLSMTSKDVFEARQIRDAALMN
jgi:hypothetical protein